MRRQSRGLPRPRPLQCCSHGHDCDCGSGSTLLAMAVVMAEAVVTQFASSAPSGNVVGHVMVVRLRLTVLQGRVLRPLPWHSKRCTWQSTGSTAACDGGAAVFDRAPISCAFFCSFIASPAPGRALAAGSTAASTSTNNAATSSRPPGGPAVHASCHTIADNHSQPQQPH